MSVDPDAVGDPSEQAADYLKDANAEDPRSDPQAPAREPAGPEALDDVGHRTDTPE